MTTRPASDRQAQAWLQDWKARLCAWYSHPDVPAAWVTRQVDRQLATRENATLSGTFAVTADGVEVGVLAIGVMDHARSRSGIISDVWIAPEHRRRGYGAAAIRAAEDWTRRHSATFLQVVTNPADPAHAALFARYPIRAHQMIRELSDIGALAQGLAGRLMTAAEFDGWRARSVQGYADDMANSGTLSGHEAAAASAAQFDELLPAGLATSGHSFLSLCAGAEVVATNWIGHAYAPGTSWVYGVEVGEGYRGRGYGRAAMVIGEQATAEAGNTHLGLNVFGHNTVAIRLYQSMGYRGYDDARSIDV